jgi:hypothetical protein
VPLAGGIDRGKIRGNPNTQILCQFGGPSFLQRWRFEVFDSATSWLPLQTTNQIFK